MAGETLNKSSITYLDEERASWAYVDEWQPPPPQRFPAVIAALENIELSCNAMPQRCLLDGCGVVRQSITFGSKVLGITVRLLLALIWLGQFYLNIPKDLIA